MGGRERGVDAQRGRRRGRGTRVPHALGLGTPQIADHAIRFFKEPTSRSYILTYAAGLDLCRAYVSDDPERFRRLLLEQVRVGDLLAAA